MPRASSFALGVVVALAAVLAVVAPLPALGASQPHPLVFTTSEFDGSGRGACIGMASYDGSPSIDLTTSVANISVPLHSQTGADCPDFQFPFNVTEGLALNLGAIDPAQDNGGRLYFVEGLEDGTSVLAYSPLARRKAVVRRPLSKTVIAISMSVPSMTPTPVLLLTSSLQGLALSEKNVVSGSETPLLSESTMESTFNMTHAVAGVLVLNDVQREVYWLGLSGRTPPLADGSLNAAALKVYALSLVDPAKRKEFALLNCPDVLSLHFSAALKALVIVTSTDVRVAALPETGLVDSALTTLATSPVLTYASDLSNFDSLQPSSAWIADGHHLVWA